MLWLYFDLSTGKLALSTYLSGAISLLIFYLMVGVADQGRITVSTLYVLLVFFSLGPLGTVLYLHSGVSALAFITLVVKLWELFLIVYLTYRYLWTVSREKRPS